MIKKTIWITGASSGIGKATAIKFADEGWKVLISARRAELLNELSKNENIFSYPLDVTDMAQTKEVFEEYIRSKAETAYHPSCTLKMGVDNMAVVDQKLKVHGIENLRVVDASVMPEITSGNLNAPTLMIAERASEFILS